MKARADTRRIAVALSSAKAPLNASSASKAFTSIELLVVLGVVGVLAAMTLTALTQAKQRAQGAYCLNNQRQLVMGWRMYAEDNNGNLVPNRDGNGVNLNSSWVVGWEDWYPDNIANTNIRYLSNTLIFPYVKSISAYKCPGDVYPCTIAGLNMPRVRSVSMNAFIEGGAYGLSGYSTWFGDSGWLAYNKFADILKPAPVDLFVFIEEHADSINDGWMVTDVTSPDYWENLPASYHNGACGVSFADGHAEMHKWLDSSTKVPVQGRSALPNGLRPAGGRDARWVIQHTSAQGR